MNTFDKVLRAFNKKSRKYFNLLYIHYLRTFTNNKDFTIISNNCWGGGIYEDLNLQYLTPTVGLFFYAEDYIKFVKKIPYYLSLPLNFVQTSKYEDANIAQNNNPYPIGLLDDVEIHFLHYKNNEDAVEKWNRRKKRVNYNNLFLKFDDRDGCTIDLIREFDEINTAKNKVVFSAKKISNINSLVYLKKYQREGMVGDLYTHKDVYRKHFNVAKWLNV